MQRLVRLLFLCVALFGLSACAALFSAPDGELESASSRPKSKTQARAAMRSVGKVYRKVAPSSEDLPPEPPRILLRDTPTMRKFLWIYVAKEKQQFQAVLDKRAEFFPMIYEVLDRYNLPPELANVAILESRLNPDARSPAGAVGLWQLMPATAREHGLSVGLFRDERKNPVKSTEAAVRFLIELHQQFGDWLLAIAAYNCGPAAVAKSVREHGTRDIVELINKGALNEETRNFVQKFIAVTMITKNALAFGFIE